MPEDKRPKRMEDSCRHRAKYQAPSTPEHFWSISFPSTQKCIERGYGGVQVINDKDDVAGNRPRRKRPLQLLINDKKEEREKNTDGAGDDDDEDFDFGE